jgi:hypothetical protein
MNRPLHRSCDCYRCTDTIPKTYVNYGDQQQKVIGGKTAFVDPRYKARSYAEAKLVEIMEKCWEFDPDQRIDMFEVVRLLREVVSENERLSKTKKNEIMVR